MPEDPPGAIDRLCTDAVRDSPASPYDAWRELSATHPEAVQLGVGFPFTDAFPTEELAAATNEILRKEPEALQYGGSEAADSLPGAIADHVGRRGLAVGADDLIVTGGASRAIDTIADVFLEPGRVVFTEEATFPSAVTYFRDHGAAVAGCALDREGLDVAALGDDLARRERTGEDLPTLLYTIPTFQNPTGTTLPEKRREALLDLATEYDFAILEDDAYGALRYDGESVPPLAAMDRERPGPDRVIHVGTAAKTIAPGVRIGWVIAPEAVSEEIERRHAGAANSFVRSAVARYLAEESFEERVAKLCESYRSRRDHMLEALEGEMPSHIGWTEPDGGFFVWVTLPDGIDAEAMLPTAAAAGVIYMPGSAFYPNEGGENRLRISFSTGSPAETERAVAALARTIESA
ncbi:PLP-dependent aminotransferase family protein [Saliphagus infecundisoli]|uniref:PLP-dependent aminotransferase family protein n=1 Tax=Saliphagus infecundisoli TaxID=1849069 RepID=A0ABD5Q9Y5_9EURY|nr:PLP-dependent aminotransferase family protein [Saliphagus infecundisoli]